MIVIVIIIILDFSSATLEARRLWKIFIGYWEKRITNQKSLCDQDTIYLLRKKDVRFQTHSDSEKGAKVIWVRLMFSYNIIIENVGVNITISSKTIYNK